MKSIHSGGLMMGARLVQLGKRNRLATLFGLLLGLVVFGPVPLHAVPTNSPPRVLFLDETLLVGSNSLEVLAAQAAIPGCAVDIVSAANWTSIPGTGNGGPTGYGFDQYRAIVIGDPQCNTSTPGYLAALTALNASKTLWTPAASGNVILEGVDNVFHAAGTNGAAKTINRGVAFAVADTNRTGFYYALSCYYDYTLPATNALLVPHLTGFGTFMVRNYPNTCFDDAHIVATHPIFTAAPPLTDAELSNWGCSTHEGFDVWPANFVVLAIALTNGTYTATDGSNGVPYILVRGEGVEVITTIGLGPPKATNDLGTAHTVCASISTNVSPYAGVPITFTIVSGPNSVTNFTTLSDSNGVACFTYTGNGGMGLDYITATYLDDHDRVITSRTVTKLWVGACASLGCPSVQCLEDGKWSYSFCITNLTGQPMNFLSFGNAPAGVTFNPSFINLSPPLGPTQSTNLSVLITGPGALTNVCFKVNTYSTNEAVPDCTFPQCVSLPACCNRVTTNTLTFVSTVGLTTTYNYSITLQNVTGNPLKWVGFGAENSCLSFLPPLINLTLPAYGGPGLLLPTQTRTLNLQVQRTAPCVASNFFLSTFDTNLIACCSTRLALPPARCVKIISPYDGSVLLTNTPVLLSAAPVAYLDPCKLKWIKFYDGTAFLGDGVLTVVGGGAGEPPETNFNLTISDLPAGVHAIVAVAELGEGEVGTGEVETSDPVEITVLAPPPHHDQEEEAPAISAAVSGSTILINVLTTPGHQYDVQYRTNLAVGDWSILRSTNGNGTVITIPDSTTNDPSRFYRAVRQP